MILLKNSLSAHFLRCGNGVEVVKNNVLVLERYIYSSILGVKYDVAGLFLDCLTKENNACTCIERESSKCGKILTSWLMWNVGYKIMRGRTHFMETLHRLLIIIQ